MANKQVTSKKTSKSSVDAIAPQKTSARATKAGAPRVTTAKHSKTITTASDAADAVAVSSASPSLLTATAAAVPVENPHEAIARIAYGYWESRGFQGGDSTSDWLRAEAEFQRKNG